jgi:hypothetical protein
MFKEKPSISELYPSIKQTLEKIPGRKAKEKWIRTQIIPKMDARGGRLESLSAEAILEKLQSTNQQKPGEEYELALEMLTPKFQNATGVTPEFALEVADVVFYNCQPKAPVDGLDSLDLFLDGILGIKMEDALALCIVKYETRLVCGDRKNYKQIELVVMEQHLAESESLRNLWPK